MLNQRRKIFWKMEELPQIYRRQNGDIKGVLYWVSLHIKHHRKIFSRHGHLAVGVYALCLQI